MRPSIEGLRIAHVSQFNNSETSKNDGMWQFALFYKPYGAAFGKVCAGLLFGGAGGLTQDLGLPSEAFA